MEMEDTGVREASPMEGRVKSMWKLTISKSNRKL